MTVEFKHIILDTLAESFDGWNKKKFFIHPYYLLELCDLIRINSRDNTLENEYILEQVWRSIE